MVSLVEHFVASGDLILPNSYLKDHSQYFAECYRDLEWNGDPSSFPFLIPNLAASFTRFVLHHNNRSYFIPAGHSFLRRDDVDYSEELLDAVKKIKVTRSPNAVLNAYYDWIEWVKMLETIEKDATIGTDLSFLQSRCLRATLLSLQTKHQLRANPTHIEGTNETESLSNQMITSVHPPPFDSDLSINVTTTSSSKLSTSISTHTSLPSDHWSSFSQLLTSEQLILSAIHLHFTRHHPTPFPWDNRPSILSESEVDTFLQPHPRFVDQNEKFYISLFDETDDSKIVASLLRCYDVLKATQSTECIVDVATFRTFLISSLHSSNFAIQFECDKIFFEIGDILAIVDDPRDSRFLSFRMVFRDGTYYQKITLLKLWWRWLLTGDGDRHGQMMTEADFDFDGLLAADLSDPHLFDIACAFVLIITISDAISMSQQWKLDFLHSFEKRHQMMSRLSCDPSPSSEQVRSRHFLSPLAITLGSLLSFYCGCDFPSALTEHVTIDSSFNPHKYLFSVVPPHLLSHTSIAPKHRRSFFPMDLMFERVLRDDPDAFFRDMTDISDFTPQKFLITPHYGLHSLLLRCPELNLDELSLHHFVNMLDVDSYPYSTQEDILNLFRHVPPPRLLDTLLSSPHLVRTDFEIWAGFQAIFCAFGEYTSPFGACSSLTTVFKLLFPFDQNSEQIEETMLRKVGEIVVSLHWLSIPSHFDSPLLCHLPSLAGAQRGVLQTLSSDFGIPSLVTYLPAILNPDNLMNMLFDSFSISLEIHLLLLGLQLVDSDDFHLSGLMHHVVGMLMAHLLFPTPAVVSIAFEFFHRYVSLSSDAVRIELVKRGLLVRIVFAVSNSSFLDDYERGIAVIGILLSTIRRDDQKRRMRAFDFSRVFRHSDTLPDNYKDQQ
ncbi:hypothetical protein BLNAU_9395 [Blattamonas nauphoetae]|uniref:BTB domain-containing protein n=1 Tax=Blattamonas nauphoetae TaxID=2049346 RepID=A0ABQ9XW52_9EUKA|nr:hypothetical protein BLNAU_9395 [Blattamonas nauphoetae]